MPPPFTEPLPLASASPIQARVWSGSLPLSIRLSPIDCRTYDQSKPYLISCPRVSYLPFLLGRLHAFFAPLLVDSAVPATAAWFSFEGVPLKWQYPIGLLYDLLLPPPASAPPSSQLPWALVLHYQDRPSDQLIPLDPSGKTLHDLFINAVKEADYLRNGTAKTIMSLSRADSTALWHSVEQHDFTAFTAIHRKFLAPAGGDPLRHIPIKFYLPKAAPASASATAETQAVWRVVQGLITPLQPSQHDPHTLGTALHALMPTLFPSRRSAIYAQAVLHGAVVPLAAPLEPLLQEAAFCDGFLHVVVRLLHDSS